MPTLLKIKCSMLEVGPLNLGQLFLLRLCQQEAVFFPYVEGGSAREWDLFSLGSESCLRSLRTQLMSSSVMQGCAKKCEQRLTLRGSVDFLRDSFLTSPAAAIQSVLIWLHDKSINNCSARTESYSVGLVDHPVVLELQLGQLLLEAGGELLHRQQSPPLGVGDQRTVVLGQEGTGQLVVQVPEGVHALMPALDDGDCGQLEGLLDVPELLLAGLGVLAPVLAGLVLGEEGADDAVAVGALGVGEFADGPELSLEHHPGLCLLVHDKQNRCRCGQWLWTRALMSMDLRMLSTSRSFSSTRERRDSTSLAISTKDMQNCSCRFSMLRVSLKRSLSRSRSSSCDLFSQVSRSISSDRILILSPQFTCRFISEFSSCSRISPERTRPCSRSIYSWKPRARDYHSVRCCPNVFRSSSNWPSDRSSPPHFSVSCQYSDSVFSRSRLTLSSSAEDLISCAPKSIDIFCSWASSYSRSLTSLLSRSTSTDRLLIFLEYSAEWDSNSRSRYISDSSLETRSRYSSSSWDLAESSPLSLPSSALLALSSPSKERRRQFSSVSREQLALAWSSSKTILSWSANLSLRTVLSRSISWESIAMVDSYSPILDSQSLPCTSIREIRSLNYSTSAVRILRLPCSPLFSDRSRPTSPFRVLHCWYSSPCFSSQDLALFSRLSHSADLPRRVTRRRSSSWPDWPMRVSQSWQRSSKSLHLALSSSFTRQRLSQRASMSLYLTQNWMYTFSCSITDLSLVSLDCELPLMLLFSLLSRSFSSRCEPNADCSQLYCVSRLRQLQNQLSNSVTFSRRESASLVLPASSLASLSFSFMKSASFSRIVLTFLSSYWDMAVSLRPSSPYCCSISFCLWSSLSYLRRLATSSSYSAYFFFRVQLSLLIYPLSWVTCIVSSPFLPSTSLSRCTSLLERESSSRRVSMLRQVDSSLLSYSLSLASWLRKQATWSSRALYFWLEAQSSLVLLRTTPLSLSISWVSRTTLFSYSLSLRVTSCCSWTVCSSLADLVLQSSISPIFPRTTLFRRSISAARAACFCSYSLNLSSQPLRSESPAASLALSSSTIRVTLVQLALSFWYSSSYICRLFRLASSLPHLLFHCSSSDILECITWFSRCTSVDSIVILFSASSSWLSIDRYFDISTVSFSYFIFQPSSSSSRCRSAPESFSRSEVWTRSSFCSSSTRKDISLSLPSSTSMRLQAIRHSSSSLPRCWSWALSCLFSPSTLANSALCRSECASLSLRDSSSSCLVRIISFSRSTSWESRVSLFSSSSMTCWLRMDSSQAISSREYFCIRSPISRDLDSSSSRSLRISASRMPRSPWNLMVSSRSSRSSTDLRWLSMLRRRSSSSLFLDFSMAMYRALHFSISCMSSWLRNCSAAQRSLRERSTSEYFRRHSSSWEYSCWQTRVSFWFQEDQPSFSRSSSKTLSVSSLIWTSQLWTLNILCSNSLTRTASPSFSVRSLWTSMPWSTTTTGRLSPRKAFLQPGRLVILERERSAEPPSRLVKKTLSRSWVWMFSLLSLAGRLTKSLILVLNSPACI